MTCYTGGGLTICCPTTTVRRKILFCPWCQVRRRFRVNSAEYYGLDWYCTWCGTHYVDEGYQPRMSESARDRNRAYAKEVWR